MVLVGTVKYLVPHATFGIICCTRLSDPELGAVHTVGVVTKQRPLPANTAIFLSQVVLTVDPLKSNPSAEFEPDP